MNQMPVLNPNIELQDTGTDVLVHDKNAGQIHVLNKTGGMVLRACDGQSDAFAIARTLMPDPSPEVCADVARAIAQFKELGLIA